MRSAPTPSVSRRSVITAASDVTKDALDTTRRVRHMWNGLLSGSVMMSLPHVLSTHGARPSMDAIIP